MLQQLDYEKRDFERALKHYKLASSIKKRNAYWEGVETESHNGDPDYDRMLKNWKRKKLAAEKNKGRVSGGRARVRWSLPRKPN